MEGLLAGQPETRQREGGPPKCVPSFVFSQGRREAVVRVESTPTDDGRVRVTATTASGGTRQWVGTDAYIDASLRFVIVGYHGIEAGYWEDPI